MQTPVTEYFPIDAIKVAPRLRTDSTQEVRDHIDRLKESIDRFGGHPHGLLQPVLLDENNVLQAGWCRYTACKELEWPTIPVHRRTKLTDTEYEEIELEENFNRLGFTWIEVVRQVCKIHANRRNWGAKQGMKWTREMTGELLGGYSKQYIDNCINIEPLLIHERYQNCVGITDAVRLMLREKEDECLREKARRLQLQHPSVPVISSTGTAEAGPSNPLLDLLEGDDTDTPATTDALTTTPSLSSTAEVVVQSVATPCVACEGTGKSSKGNPCVACNGTGLGKQTVTEPQIISLSSTIFHGDSTLLLPQWPAACVDHIITDPPYGIDPDDLDQSTTSLMDMSRVAETHQVEENLNLFRRLLPSAFHVLKPGGYCIWWCDIMNWQYLYDLATLTGFKVQRWPLVWYKTSLCKNQMAHVNTTKNFELALVLRKGQANLRRPVPSSVIVAPNDDLKLSNPFAKPFDVWKFCFDSFTSPGQVVLDPCAGEGSSIISGFRLNRRMLAVETLEHQYIHLLDNVRTYWTSIFKEVKFV